MTDIEGFLAIYGHSDNLLNNKMGYKGISGLHGSQGLRVIGVMQAIMVSLNYTLANLVSTAVSLQFLYR